MPWLQNLKISHFQLKLLIEVNEEKINESEPIKIEDFLVDSYHCVFA